jgi:hypothetical protein
LGVGFGEDDGIGSDEADGFGDSANSDEGGCKTAKIAAPIAPKTRNRINQRSLIYAKLL